MLKIIEISDLAFIICLALDSIVHLLFPCLQSSPCAQFCIFARINPFVFPKSKRIKKCVIRWSFHVFMQSFAHPILQNFSDHFPPFAVCLCPFHPPLHLLTFGRSPHPPTTALHRSISISSQSLSSRMSFISLHCIVGVSAPYQPNFG